MDSYLILKSVQADRDANPSAAKANSTTREITMEKRFSNTQKIKPKNNEEILRKRKERFGEASPLKPKFLTGTSTKQVHILPNANLNILKKRKERFGESVSSLLKKIEEKEKLMKRAARFSDKSPIPVQAKQVKLKNFESRSDFPSGIEAFQTIDQIEENERRKRKWKD